MQRRVFIAGVIGSLGHQLVAEAQPAGKMWRVGFLGAESASAPPGMWTRSLRAPALGKLPVEQATQFEFVINLKTAKTVGLKISRSLLLRADETIP